MATEIIMPKAGMAMEEGVITQWLKEVGDTVKSGEPIMEIETDKIVMEIEAYADGVLLAKFFENDAVVPVTTVVGYIGNPGEKVPDAPNAASSPTSPTAADTVEASPASSAVASATQQNATFSSGVVKATPYAKTLASQAGVDLSTISASGAGGVIKARDVQAVKATPLAKRVASDRGVDLATVAGTGFGGKVMQGDIPPVKQEPSAPTADEVVPLTGMRSVIAKRMQQAHSEVPPVTQNMKAYVDELLEMRVKINSNGEQKITINDIIIKACAKAVSEFPQIRSEIDMSAGQLIIRGNVNIGVAVALDQGLIVPVLTNADKMPLSVISSCMKDLSKRAKAGCLQPHECTGSTFTISNPGALGIHDFTPIINQPNAAILGIGCLNDELALDGSQVISRKYMMLSLSYDHRIIDGADAAIFQARVKQLLENPLEMLI